MANNNLPHDHGETDNLFALQHYLDDTDDFQIVAEVFKQLGDSSRLRIFWLLCHYEECVLNIAALLNMSSPAVSHHLKSLKSNNLIISRRDGKEVYYKASNTPQCLLLHEMIEDVMKISCPVSPNIPGHNLTNHHGSDHIHETLHTCSGEHIGHHDHTHSVSADLGQSASHVDDYHIQHCTCDHRHTDLPERNQYQEEQLSIIHKIHDRLINDIEKRWTVEELSKQYLMNPTTLKTLFKTVYGNSIAAHIKEHRMEEAARLLSDSDNSLADIAATIGYNSQSKFTAAFKEFYLMLPKEYRRIHQRRKQMKAIVILAGGKSSRMGQDKVFLNYNGKTFLDIMLENAWKEFDRVIIAAGSREHAEKIYNYLKDKGTLCTNKQPEIIIDKYKEIGPMGGILSAFEQTKLDQFAVTAIDIPAADMKVLAAIYEELALTSNPSVCAAMLLSSNGHIEPCAAAYNKKAYSNFANAQKNGSFGILKVLESEEISEYSKELLIDKYPELATVDIDKAFTNINTPEDFSRM